MELIIDLHLNDSDPNFDPKNALYEQMKQFEKSLDEALFKNCNQMRVIHGIGSGKLRDEIFKYLKNNNYIRHFKNEWHPKYGMGSTLIEFI